MDAHSIAWQLDDQRVVAPPSPLSVGVALKEHQRSALERVLRRDHAVLEAPTGSGKTDVALAAIAMRGVPTLVLVPTNPLVAQWRQRITEKLGIPARAIGRITGKTARLGALVTVATFQALARHDLQSIAGHFSQVVVDECHHVGAPTFAGVIRQLPARYLLGLSATARRKDGLTPLIFHYLGDRIKSATPRTLVRSGAIVLPQLVPHRTDFEVPDAPHYAALLGSLADIEARADRIAADVIAAVHEGHNCLVLSERKDHCERFHHLLEGRVGVATLYGRVSRREIQRTMDEVASGSVQVVVSTTHLVGEGWDCPSLSALFLALPVAAGPRLEQLVGRVTRVAEDKLTPVLHDYVDEKIPVFAAMARKRHAALRRLLGQERMPGEERDRSSSRRASVSPMARPGRRREAGGQLMLPLE